MSLLYRQLYENAMRITVQRGLGAWFEVVVAGYKVPSHCLSGHLRTAGTSRKIEVEHNDR
jgi:hypothetical protein